MAKILGAEWLADLMKKFYLCKLCVIVFGALLAVQSA